MNLYTRGARPRFALCAATVTRAPRLGDSARLGCPLGAALSAPLDSARRGAARLRSARLGSARRGAAPLRSTRLGAARLCFAPLETRPRRGHALAYADAQPYTLLASPRGARASTVNSTR